MPEIRECIAHFRYLKIFYDHCTQNHQDLHLVGLWADASKKEEGIAPDGNVYCLGSDSTAVRGSQGGQTSLWPPTFQSSVSNPQPRPISTLVWQGISYTCRAIILDFGELWFQLAYLTHTSIQVFSRKVWEDIVMQTPKATRGYRIGLAIEFSHSFVAFLTIDQIIQVHWAPTMNDLPTPPSDVYHDFFDFLDGVAAWIMQRTKSSRSNRSGFAAKAMRKANKVWGGVGVYTVNEIFFLAGLSLFLREHEVFDNPSRTARLCCALWTFAYISHSEKIMKDLIKPAVRDGIVAPTRLQRLKYLRYLHVFAKERTHGSVRMGKLVKEYKDRLHYLEKEGFPWFRDDPEESQLYDYFEPTFLRSCYESSDKKLFLGSLIFGTEEWARLCSDSERLTPVSKDPLTVMFSKRVSQGLLSSPTHLKSGSETYTTLLLPDSRRSLSASHFPTYAYRDTSEQYGKQMWSVVPAFGQLSSHRPLNAKKGKAKASPADPTATLIVSKERKSMLFSHIVSYTNQVAIGPLEYCGNGTVAYNTRGVPIVSAVRIPGRALIQQHRDSLSSNRKTDGPIEYESEQEEEEDFELPDYVDSNFLSQANPSTPDLEADDTIFGFESEPDWTTDADELPPETGAEDDTDSSVALLSDAATDTSSIPLHTTKKRKRYSTGDREILAQARRSTVVLSDDEDEGKRGAGGSSSRPIRTTRNQDPQQFIRVPRQYNKKK